MVTAHFSTRKRDGVPSTRFDRLNAAIGHSGDQTLRLRTRGRRPKGTVQVPVKARWFHLSRLKNACPRTISREADFRRRGNPGREYRFCWSKGLPWADT